MSKKVFFIAAVQGREPFEFWRGSIIVEGESDIDSLEKALVATHAQSHSAFAATVYQLRKPRVLRITTATSDLVNFQALLQQVDELLPDGIIQDVLLTTQTLIVLLQCVALHVPVSPTAGEIVGQLQRGARTTLTKDDEQDLPRPRKRARTTTTKNDEEDSFQFLEHLRNKHSLSQMELPSIAGLRSFLNTPLEEPEKITISQHLFDGFLSNRLDDRCTERDISALFKIGNVGPASLPFVNVIGSPDPSRTEDGYHYFWDLSLRQILRALIPDGEAIRNTNYYTETRNARPDFGYLINMRCVFRGEEKGPTSPGDPAVELTQKLEWAYDSAPYILGYYADMTRVTFVALEHLDGRTQRTDLETIDLKRTVDRIFNLRRLINMSFILRRLADMVHDPTPEFLLHERPNCTISFVNNKYVMKTFTCSNSIARVKHLKMVYDSLKEAGVPNTDSLVSIKDSVVFLEPIGVDTPPNTTGQLRECILCILDALKKAHKIPLYHRDIRKENVIRSMDDPSKWFLIDWEDASTKPTLALPNVKRETHSPAVLENDHGPEVDIWGVGYLIKTADDIFPTEIRELGDRICRDSHKLTALETQELFDKSIIINNLASFFQTSRLPATEFGIVDQKDANVPGALESKCFFSSLGHSPEHTFYQTYDDSAEATLEELVPYWMSRKIMQVPNISNFVV